MPQPNDLSRSLVALDQDSTLITVVEMSQSSWLVGGMIPGIERQPRKKLEPSPERLLALLHRWRDEAVKATVRGDLVETVKTSSEPEMARPRPQNG
jgi:transposase